VTKGPDEAAKASHALSLMMSINKVIFQYGLKLVCEEGVFCFEGWYDDELD
jgi:hypothetical protein